MFYENSSCSLKIKKIKEKCSHRGWLGYKKLVKGKSSLVLNFRKNNFKKSCFMVNVAE